jgi:DNA-binding CsgD family transcriptional regulator
MASSRGTAFRDGQTRTLKSDAARDLPAAVEALQSKRMLFTPRVNDLVLAGFLEKGHAISRNEPPDLPTLTAREREVRQLLAEGKSSKGVAVVLNLSTKTVEPNRSNILRKLSCIPFATWWFTPSRTTSSRSRCHHNPVLRRPLWRNIRAEVSGFVIRTPAVFSSQRRRLP